MNLQELKDKIREDMPEYAEAIVKIQKAAIEDRESYVDFYESDIPDAVRKLLEDEGYLFHRNGHRDRIYRVYGWAGDVEHN